MKGKKVGWEVHELKLGKHAGKDVLVVTSEVYLAIKFMGVKGVMEEKATAYYELEGEGTILQAETRSVQDKKVTLRRAVRKGKGMVLTTQEGARKSERKIAVPRDTLASDRAFEVWLQGPPRKGAQFSKYTANWDEDEIDVKETYTFKEKKTILWGGVKTEVYLAQKVVNGAKTDVQLLADGQPLTEQLGELITLRLEKESVAKKLDAEGVDLLTSSSVEVDRKLGDSERVEKLTLEVTGLGDFALPESHRQRLRPGKGVAVLELSRDHRVKKVAPLTDKERALHLKATPNIQSDHSDLRKRARLVVGKEKDPVKQATLLSKWVYKNVRKSYSDNATNALAVLDSLAGDCTEHTLLFVALARAAGLPAREVGGLAYVEEDKPLFGWHAWAEVHDGSQWVTVDPTWDQVYVDATHIKFSEGAADFAWVNVAGKLKFKVAKVERTK
jgi:hypothetical protein